MTKPISRKMAVDCLLHYAWDGALVTPPSETAGTKRFIVYIPCGICHKPLLAGDIIQFDHIHAIVHGGPHEYQNLRPVHAECHKEKTKRDIAANAKVKRILADKPSKRPMARSGSPLPGSKQSKWKKKMSGEVLSR